MFMRNVLVLLTVIFALLIWTFVGLNENSIQIHDVIQSPVDMTDGNKPQHERANIRLNPMEELSLKLTMSTSSGSLSYDTVFFLILIHMCGADVAAPISTLYHHMCWAWSFIDPALSVICVIMVARTIFQGKREKAELVKNNMLKDKQKEDVVTTLMEVKAELENQRNQLKKQLKVVEADKEKNKQDLQSVEQEITEREKNFNKPEELLRKKENLSQTQWKLDQTEKGPRRQLLNTEKLMEPIETLFQGCKQRAEKRNLLFS